MSKLTCSVDGCEKLGAYANGNCPMHYQRFRKSGSYDPPHRITHCVIKSCGAELGYGRGRGFCRPHYRRWRKICILTPCSIDGCDGIVQARGWCPMHLTRWDRYGNPEHRYGYEVRDGKRVCPGCHVDKPLEDYSPGSTGRCKRCQADLTALRRFDNPQPKRAKFPVTCPCGATFDGDKRRSTYCSAGCFKEYKNKLNWVHMNRRRARLRGAFVEAFDRREIFERDRWVCQLCLEPTDREAAFPDPMMASLDHIIPVSRGGKHARSNAQTTHLGCNVRKGASIPT